VTYRGHPVALILPLDTKRAEEEMVQAASKQALAETWGRYERLADEIRNAWPPDLSSQDVMDGVRC